MKVVKSCEIRNDQPGDIKKKKIREIRKVLKSSKIKHHIYYDEMSEDGYGFYKNGVIFDQNVVKY